MSACIELARRLGKALADSPQATAYRAAREELNAQPDVRQTLQAYQQQAEKVARLEAEEKPVEVEDKHRLQELNNQLIASEVFKKLTAAQVEWVDLMRRVNQALEGELTEVEG